MPTTTKPAQTSSKPTQQPPMSTKPANMPKGCPGKLGKDFEVSSWYSSPLLSCIDLADGFLQFPHQIIHINSAEPDKAYGNFFNGTMTSTVSSMFNFDIPADAAGKTCSLEFMFPTQDQLETSAYTISGDGKANFYTLEKPAHKSNTFNTSPKSDKVKSTTRFCPLPTLLTSIFTVSRRVHSDPGLLEQDPQHGLPRRQDNRHLDVLRHGQQPEILPGLQPLP